MTTSKTFFAKNQREWNSALISCGVYQTKGYWSKEYCSKSGLAKGLKALGYKSNEPYNGENWNYGGNQYTVIFNYN